MLCEVIRGFNKLYLAVLTSQLMLVQAAYFNWDEEIVIYTYIKHEV